MRDHINELGVCVINLDSSASGSAASYIISVASYIAIRLECELFAPNGWRPYKIRLQTHMRFSHYQDRFCSCNAAHNYPRQISGRPLDKGSDNNEKPLYFQSECE